VTIGLIDVIVCYKVRLFEESTVCFKNASIALKDLRYCGAKEKVWRYWRWMGEINIRRLIGTLKCGVRNMAGRGLG
jgi:hypothetical protein